MANVKVNIPTIINRLKKLKKFDNIVFKVATRMKLLLVRNWDVAIGADAGRFKGLTQKYKDKKPGSGIRNLTLTGSMRRSLAPIKKKDSFWILKFRGNESKKARGNVKHAPNMMSPISDKIDSALQDLAFKEFTR